MSRQTTQQVFGTIFIAFSKRASNSSVHEIRVIVLVSCEIVLHETACAFLRREEEEKEEGEEEDEEDDDFIRKNKDTINPFLSDRFC